MNEKIINNYKLIYVIMNELHCDKKDEEEYFFYGLMGLYKGIKNYDATKEIKETTFYTRCIKNEILARFNYKTRKKRDIRRNEISINTPISKTHTIEDVLVSDVDIEKEIIKKEQLELLYKALNETKNTQYKQYILDFYGINRPKKKLCEIALKYDVDIHNVSMSIRQGIKYLRKKVKKEYEKESK